MQMDVANNVPSRPESQPPTNAATTRPGQQSMRRRIEYILLAREIDTYGGRDVHAIDAEWTNQMSRRLLRDIHEWGTVDTEHLSMSLRSRLAIELSYALTTFTVLSTMRAQTPGSGFPIVKCPELLDDALDLMEGVAFGGPETSSESPSTETGEKIHTNRELVAVVQETEGRPFAPLELHQGSKEASLGPMPRPGNIVISVVAIVRNLSIINDNVEFLASFPRLADRLLRLSIFKQCDGRPPTPSSLNMSLADLLLVRRETIFILVNLAGFINLSALPHNRCSNCKTNIRIDRVLPGSSDGLRPSVSICPTFGRTP
jgi:SWI/SNF chromatin-remodeling complex subunit SWI1